MTAVQRLFDKGYTPRTPHRGLVSGTDGNRGRRTATGGVGVAVGVACLLLVGGLVPGASARPTPTVQPWTQYDTGRVNVVFPAQLPVVELVQDANSSVSATLQLLGVYEVSPGGFPLPTVVAAAFPSSATAFNSSSPAASTGGPTTMGATLTVYPVGAPIWNATAAPLAPVGLPRGSTSLTLSSGPSQSTSVVAGVAINWSVSGWPWSNANDLLALRFSFDFASGAALTACTGSSLFTRTIPACIGESVAPGSAVYSQGFSSFEGENGTGPIAVVTWGSSAVVGTTMTPVTAAGYSVAPGVGELLLCAPSSQGTAVSGTMGFALVAPTQVLPQLLHGDLVAYAVALATIAAVALAGVLAYRRRDRRIRDEL